MAKGPSTKTSIADLLELDSELEKMSALRDKLDAIDANTESAIHEIKTNAAALAQAHAKALEAAEQNVIGYLLKNRDTQFKESRSIKLAHGTVGFRTSSTIILGEKTLAKLKKIEGGEKAIIVKEEPNKNVLATWENKDLRKVGASRSVEDRPFYKLTAAEVTKRKRNAVK